MKVNYDDMASIFHHENKLTRSNFYTLIKDRTGTSIDIPCASGVRLPILSKNYDFVYAYDLSYGMIDFINIKFGNINNMKSGVFNILDLEKLNILVDDLFVLEYAIQFFNLKEIKKIISSFSKVSKYVFIEIYNYKNLYEVKKEEFLANDASITLEKRYLKISNKVYIKKTYFVNEKKSYVQSLQLYNYSYKILIKTFQLNGFKLENIYENYKKNINKSSQRKILVFKNDN